MERKISSSLTEFYKVYSILSIVLLAGLFTFGFFEFGKEVCFISKGFTRLTPTEIIEELNRTVIRSRRNELINSALRQLNN